MVKHSEESGERSECQSGWSLQPPLPCASEGWTKGCHYEQDSLPALALARLLHKQLELIELAGNYPAAFFLFLFLN